MRFAEKPLSGGFSTKRKEGDMGDVIYMNEYKARRALAAFFPLVVAVVLLVVFFGAKK